MARIGKKYPNILLGIMNLIVEIGILSLFRVGKASMVRGMMMKLKY